MIRDLYAEVRSLDATIYEHRERIDHLEGRIAALEAEVADLRKANSRFQLAPER